MIATECHPDTYLIRHVFGIGRKLCSHQRSKGEVINYVLNNSDAIGMIDEDPDSHQPVVVTSAIILNTNGNLKLLGLKNGSHLIQISPRLEEWIYQRAKAHHMDPKLFHLPRDPDELHSIPHYERKSGYQEFITILAKKDSEIQILREWITSKI